MDILFTLLGGHRFIGANSLNLQVPLPFVVWAQFLPLIFQTFLPSHNKTNAD
jgi:hypothetical protein